MKDWESVFAAYYPAMVRFVRSLCHDEQLSKDIASEAFGKAMQSKAGLKKEESMQNWLFTIARNTLYSYWKRNENKVLFDSSLVEDQMEGESRKDPEKSESTDLLPELIHRLDHPGQEIVMWRLYGSMDFNRIGELFGRSGNWACVNYHRALDRLKKTMEEQQKGENGNG